MRTVTLLHPKRLVVGAGCADQVVADPAWVPRRRVFVVCDPHLVDRAASLAAGLRDAGLSATTYAEVSAEPAVEAFEDALVAARAARADAFVGIGGGSVLDVAKLLNLGTSYTCPEGPGAPRRGGLAGNWGLRSPM